MTLTLKEYAAQLRLLARGFGAEGWSQTAIAKELGVPREDVRNWLRSQIGQKGPSPENGQNGLSSNTRYHLANCRLEDFQPPDVGRARN